MSELGKKVAKLATAENHLWEITAKNHFAKIDGGEALVAKIDKYFAENKATSTNLKNLDFLADKSGKLDPEVAAFAKAHPKEVAGFVEYANQYGKVAEASKALPEKLAAETIATVDKLYHDGKYVEGEFDAKKITAEVTRKKQESVKVNESEYGVRGSVSNIKSASINGITIEDISSHGSNTGSRETITVAVPNRKDVVVERGATNETFKLRIGENVISGEAASKFAARIADAVHSSLKDDKLTSREASLIINDIASNAPSAPAKEQHTTGNKHR